MSPPPQKQPPRPFSPAAYQNAASPTNSQGYVQPPAKRQRLSPDARSPAQQNGVIPPYAASPHGLPNMATPGGYGNPYAQQQSPYASPSTYAGSPQTSFNTPQVHPNNQQQWYSQPPTPAGNTGRQMSPPNSQSQHMPSSQMMPPPPRPNKEDNERMSVDDMNDPMHGSGINLKDEEDNLHSYSFHTNHSTSFGSLTMSPNNSFNQLTQGTSFDGHRGPGGALAGTLGAVQSQEEVENELKRKRAAAAGARNERIQHHMANQFLSTNSLRARMEARARECGVLPNYNGLYKRQDTQPRTNVMMNGHANEGIVSSQADDRPEFTAEKGGQFAQVLGLVSIAAGERLRDLIDEAFAMARARRFGDHGRVPPDFADIAVGAGERQDEEVRPENITGSQWDKVPTDAQASSHAPNGEQLTNGTNASTPQPQPQHTISFSNAVTTRLRDLAKRDKDAEAARLRKRDARRKRAEAAAAANGTEDAGFTSAPAADAAAAAAAPDATAEKKLSKKEQERLKKEDSKKAEANTHFTTNQTAALASLPRKARRYDWMTGGAANMPTNRFAKPAGGSTSGTATPAAAAGVAIKQEGGLASAGSPGVGVGGAPVVEAPKVVEWGGWREDGAGGQGIQARDWVAVLERDERERKALQRVLNRLK